MSNCYGIVSGLRSYQIFLLGWVTAGLLSACRADEKMFTRLETDATNITFANHITETEELNINAYLYAHNGGGVSVGDINRDGLPDLYFTANQLPNRLYLNRGGFTFEDVTEKAGVAGLHGDNHWTTGTVMADVNGDGWLDIYVCQVSKYKNFEGHNQLFINKGAPAGQPPIFTEQARDYQLDFQTYSQQAAFFDYDRDGDLDMYLLNHAVHNPDVYINASQRTKPDSLAGDRLLRNDDGVFSDVTGEAGIYSGVMGYGLAVGVGDIDNNGCPDLYVSNDFHENDYVYYNNCDGTFREDVKGTLGHVSTFSMGNDIADVNNDGLLDIITMDMKPEDEVIRKQSAGSDPYDIYNYKLSFGYFYQYPRNMLHLNRGNLFADNVQFSEIGQFAGIDATDWSWSVLMADFDNDSRKDIFITNGILRRPIDLDYINYNYAQEAVQHKSQLEMAHLMPDGAVANYAYRNTGNAIFTNVSTAWGLDDTGYSTGAAYADLDDDGDLDLVVNELNAPAVVYRNNAEKMGSHHFVKVKLAGGAPNVYGIGSRVTVETGENTMMQELQPGRGWLSSVDHTLSFGLGTTEKIEKITVRWPDGSRQELKNVPVNQTLTIRQQDNLPDEDAVPTPSPRFADITEQADISFHHQENHFIDFNTERLLPHMLSCEGPKMAVADVNQDGLEDFFIAGAAGQASELYLQNSSRLTSFSRSSAKVFEDDQEKEDVDATFLDADGDGDMDLYVVSGGGQYPESSNNQDRLYLNDGSGNFSHSASGLPAMKSSGSCVVAADFNGDTYMDVFVGTRSVVGAYGLSPDSYLLWNDGQGHFERDSSEYTQALRQLGMVTDAVWLPEAKRLAVVGEWMPITFLSFEKNKLEKREIPNTAGWWNSIQTADLNQDGQPDLLAGNMGLNSDFKASPEEPLGLYVKDFDRNLSVEPIITYYRHQQKWVYTGLDALKQQMPAIRLKYKNYASYASHTFDQVFPEEVIEGAVMKQAELFQSVYLLNQGDGEYDIQEFPLSIQYAPLSAFVVEDFNEDGVTDILAAGNFYGNDPGQGRYDASYGHFLEGEGEGRFKEIEPRTSGFAVYGEVRDMKLIRTADAPVVIISRNSAIPRVIQPVKRNTTNHLTNNIP